MSPGWWLVAPVCLGRSSWGGREIVFDVDAFGDVVGREDDDFVVRELAAVGGEDFWCRFRDVDGRFAIFGFWLLRLCFQGFGDCGELFIYHFDLAAETGDAALQAINLALHLFDGRGSGVELFRHLGLVVVILVLLGDGGVVAGGFH